MPTLDPWLDARAIAEHLHRPESELLVTLGAEAWCQKCQRLRPSFETLCASAMSDQVLWMWLDLEDHAEFLNGFIPPDLPLLLRWRRGVCVQAAIVEDIDLGAPPPERVTLQSLVIEGTRVRDPHQGELVELPRLWTEFASASWASGV